MIEFPYKEKSIRPLVSINPVPVAVFRDGSPRYFSIAETYTPTTAEGAKCPEEKVETWKKCGSIFNLARKRSALPHTLVYDFLLDRPLNQSVAQELN